MLESEFNLLKVKTMKTELFLCPLNNITKILLAIIPAQRLTVQQAIQTSQPKLRSIS